MAKTIDISIKSNIKEAATDTKTFADSLKTATTEVSNLNTNLDMQTGIINDLEKDLIGMEAKLRDTPKTGAAGFYALEKAIAATKDEIKLEKLGMKDLNQEMKVAQREQKKYEKAIKDVTKAQLKKTKAEKKGNMVTRTFAKAGKMLGKAFKGLGIGMLVGALALLWKGLQKNKKAMDIIEKVTSTVASVFGQVADVLMDVYEWVTSSSDRFDGLTKVVKGLITLALTPLKMAFYTIKLAVQALMLAYETSIFGSGDHSKIASLRAGILETKDAMVEVGEAAIEAGGDIVNNIGDAIGEIGAIVTMAADGIAQIDIAATYAASGALVEAQNNAVVLEALLNGKIAAYQRDLDMQARIRDDESKTMQERYSAALAMDDILAKQTEARMALADLAVEQAQKEYDQSQGNLEMQAALLTAINDRAAVEAELEGIAFELAEGKAALLEEQKVLDQEAYDKKIEDEMYLLELQQENLLAGIESIREAALMELEIQKEKDIAAAMEHENYEAIIAEINIKYDRKEAAVNKAADIQDKKMAKQNFKDKVGYAKQAFDGIAAIMGKESKAGKAAAAASATISALQGATSAFASLAPIPFVGPVLGGIAAAAALVAGYANVKKIYATPGPDGGGGGGGGGPDGEVPAATSIADADVGDVAPEMTGGAFDLGSGGEAPGATEAYVVADNMTSEQETLAAIRRRASV
jgi:hypothetical protein|tara:strand:+ start:4081 stop:6168 length:2088 start_codon:yes stop_codon:yes gene_type:complete